MEKASAAKPRLALAGLVAACLLAAGCGGDAPTENVVEIGGGDGGNAVDLDAYVEQRLADGAITLIDAATADGTLLPAPHRGPTLGEIEEARKDRERAAAAAGASRDSDDTPDRSPAAETERTDLPILTVDPVVAQ